MSYNENQKNIFGHAIEHAKMISEVQEYIWMNMDQIGVVNPAADRIFQLAVESYKLALEELGDG